MCFLFCVNATYASHIVGGELTYKHLGNNEYQIRLALYVDCVNGQPLAILQDTNAVIGIFDSTNTLLSTISILRTLPVRITSLNYKCVIPPPNACIDMYTYIDTITLPPRPGGYILAYQRCCRNNTIVNIINPASTGATYWTKIPDFNISGYNNSAVFDSLPANFLCTNNPFVFDHSASDSDSDSLVYELYQPYIGGNSINSLPRPPANPPYNNVIWRAPYNNQNMMGGNPLLTIDQQSGLLTVTPTIVGQFVVGILVKEYRNGVLINITRRDYQFNVLNCNFDVISAFGFPMNYCSPQVNFNNQSTGGANYSWDFGIDSLSSDTSSIYSPVYNYPGIGTYNVTLIAYKNNCSDTFTTQINILDDSVVTAGEDGIICAKDSFELGKSDTSSRVSWTWSPGKWLSDSTISNPNASPPETQIYVIKKSSSNCFVTDTVLVSVIQSKADFTPVFSPICDTLKANFINNGSGDKFTWDFGDNSGALDFVKSDHEHIFSLPGIYIITLVSEKDGCFDTVSQALNIYEDTTSFAGNDTTVCQGVTIKLGRPNTSNGYNFQWYPVSGIDNPLIAEPFATIDSNISYYVEKSKAGCIISDTVNISVKPINSSFTYKYRPPCDGLKVKFTSTSTSPDSEHWDFGVIGAADDTSNASNPFFNYPSTGIYPVQLINYKNGCTDTSLQSILLYSDTISSMVTDTSICSFDSIQLAPYDTISKNIYHWTPAEGLNDPNISNPKASPEESTFYIREKSFEDCVILDKVKVSVYPVSAKFKFIRNINCESSRVEFLADEALAYEWDFGDGSTSTERSHIHHFEGGKEYSVKLKVFNQYCMDEMTEIINIPADPDNELIIPNVFTPNDDGINDCFRANIALEHFNCFEIYIYNRWGQLIFDSHTDGSCWDGRVRSGIPAEPGVYYYIMNGRGKNQEGTVTLIRE